MNLPRRRSDYLALIGTGLAVLTAVVNIVMFAARITPAVDRLSATLERVIDKLDIHETRISRLEGLEEARGTPPNRTHP